MLVVRDRVGMAYMGRPFAPYLSLGVFILSNSINSRGPMVSQAEIPFLGVFPSLAWGSGEPPTCGGASVPMPIVW